MDAEDRLVAMLVERALLTPEGAERARLAAAQSRTAFACTATRLGLVPDADMARAFTELLGIELAGRESFPAEPLVAAGLNPRFLAHRQAVVLAQGDGTLDVAMANPLDRVAVDGIALATGKQVRLVAATESDVADYHQRHGAIPDAPPSLVNTAASAGEDLDVLSDRASDSPVIRAVQRWLTQAVDARASDVHIEPAADALDVRQRVDGLLQPLDRRPPAWSEAVASRLKLMAKLDISEKRLPQDGRIRLSSRGRSIDVRLATFPTLHGESLVLRLLGRQDAAPELAALGLSAHAEQHLRHALRRPHGLVLLTGPTGSGKTTTLYAALRAVLRPQLKVVTVEDPVECTLAGVAQLQVRPDLGLDYASALRAVLRNDPDVVMIGEIRDRETADIAVRASLTGHLVLSTLHTNSAAGAVTRLLDLGIEPFLLSTTLVFSAAQRLVRRLCPHCRTMAPPRAEVRRLMEGSRGARREVPDRLPVAAGCAACRGTGFAGRLPLFEALPVGLQERTLIRDAEAEDVLAQCARRRGCHSLWDDGWDKVAQGLTTADEVLRAVEEHAT